MPYPGVPKELWPKMERCVSKVMKDGKSKPSAIAICKTSIMSQKSKSKDEKKPERIVEGKETRLVYFSHSPVKEQTLNASKEGKMLKNVEIFKSGTYRGTQFKNSGLDKMVANFHYLKAYGIFPNVPVRADHPSFGFFGGGGDIIDKVGGYISDLKRVGNKLVADFRITSQKMWEKVSEGSYISRSAEIGTYDDNDGTVYSPVLFGVAWVDIPQVEGLSPKFSYDKLSYEEDNKTIELINLNNFENMENDTIEDDFPPKDENNDIIPEADQIEEEKKEKINDSKVNNNKLNNNNMKEKIEENKVVLDFEKNFPEEAKELKELRVEKEKLMMKQRESFVDSLEKEGKIIPAEKEKEMEFVKSLTQEQFEKYEKKDFPQIVKMNQEEVKTEEPEKKEEPAEKTTDEKADDFIKETGIKKSN